MIAGGFAFLAGYVLGGVLFVTGALWLGPARTDPLRELLANGAMAVYLVIVQAFVNAAAFTVVSAVAPKWRRLSSGRRVATAACLGVVAHTFNWLGLWAAVVGPVASVAGPVVAVWLMLALPGLLAGLLAVLTLAL